MRREAAMAVQRILSWRLTRMKWTHNTRFHDITNALWSINQAQLLEDCKVPFVEDHEGYHMFEQRVTYNTLRFEDEEGTQEKNQAN